METLRTQHSDNFVSIAEGIKLEGRKEGELSGIKRVAFSMIQNNYSNKAIMKLTSLPENEIEYLRTIDISYFDLKTV